ncbi:MAG: methionyl-tRNA formyltransferase [Alphaproteobacteria bacterium]|nr:methionyl-tRNA formyltransferase [Alphaproteobacteria bacterium]
MPPELPLNIVFMGSPDFAVPALKALVQAGHRIKAVYAQPPKPAGRGQKERPCPVHAAAMKMGAAVKTPKTLKEKSAQDEFAALKADIAVVAAYGLILPPAILNAPRLGSLNIHASLLPRWRGAAPIQRAIETGDRKTGVTIMRMDEGLDTGAMLMAEETDIAPDDTGGTLHDRLSEIGARLIVRAVTDAAAGKLKPVPQPEAGVTYAKKLGRDEGKLDWTRPAEDLARRVRAFDPWPGTWFEMNGERIKVLAAAAEKGTGAQTKAPPVGAQTKAPPGTVLDDRALVACGEGALRLLQLQRAGRGAMAADAFLRGFALAPKTVLG